MKKTVIVILLVCRNNCIFCSPNPITQTISEKEIKKIEYELLKDILELRKKEFDDIEISGSDPIQYSKISGLVRWLKKIGFKYVEILTHGRDLSDPRLVKKLREAGLNELRIPLYGSNAIIHDSITQSEGSFDETLRGIQNIKEYAPVIKLTLTSMFMKQNCKDMLNILKLSKKYSSNIVFGVPHLRKDINYKKFAISFSKMKPYLLSLIKYSEKKNINIHFLDIPFCVFGFYKSCIDNNDNISPESASNDLYPDIYKVKDLPNFPEYRIKTKLKICEECKFNSICDGFLKQYINLFGNKEFKAIK